jgi:hypothetical protein
MKTLYEAFCGGIEEVPIAPSVRLTCHSRSYLGLSSHGRMVKLVGSSCRTAVSDKESMRCPPKMIQLFPMVRGISAQNDLLLRTPLAFFNSNGTFKIVHGRFQCRECLFKVVG